MLKSIYLLLFWGAYLAQAAPAPTDLEKDLGRYVGQTNFYQYQRRQVAFFAAAADGLESVTAAPKGGGTDQREIQESDVFKAGPAGSQLLYALNSYRGLQAIQLKKDAKTVNSVEAQLVGRAEPTGNYPADMYIVGKKLIVLERIYFQANSKSSSEDQSRLVVYDISNPTTPKQTAILPFKGDLADSRLVGDVLYVGSRVDPRWYETNDTSNAAGYVTSFSVKGEVKVINEHQLSAPMSYGKNMNIMEVPQQDGSYKYYLAAVTSSRPAYWFQSQKNFVELVDITDPHGSIAPVLRVPVRGSVNKGSQLILKDDNLIVVSNYRPGAGDWRTPARNAVEVFQLPKADSIVVDSQEADFRMKWQQRELRRANLTDPDAIDKKTAELNRDPQYGLYGVFVQSDGGPLFKMYPDFVDTRGATEPGISASLQDVRTDGNLLYVFWVPANQVDPLDLYDISNLKEGPKYLNRTSFDGWVERSFPISYKGKKYVIGLGQIVASGDNERGTRTSQAALFEIVTKRGKVGAEFVHQIALTETNGWSQLRGQDKLTTLKMTGEGQGQILFSQSTVREGRWVSGGKLVHFDLTRADEDAESVFKEGAFLEGSAGYLKRIFYNDDIGRIASLSDQALAIYSNSSATDTNALLKASYVLELARNIKAYLVAGSDGHKTGLQIVSSGNSWYSSETSQTEIRSVPLSDPDQEIQPTTQKVSLLGSYVSHQLMAPGVLAVLTMERTYAPEYSETVRLYTVKIDQLSTSATAGEPLVFANKYDQAHWRRYSSTTLTKFSDEELILSTNNQLVKIRYTSADPQVTKYDLPEIKPSSEDTLVSEQSTVVLDGRMYLFYTVAPQRHAGSVDTQETNLEHQQRFLASLEFGDGQLKVGPSINIPGRPLSLKGQQLVVQDQWVLDVVEYSDAYDGRVYPHEEVIEQDGLLSLQLAENKATVRDILTGYQNWQWTVLKDASLVSVESPAADQRGWWSGRSYPYYDNPGVQRFHFLSTEDFQFHHEIRGVRMNTSAALSLNAIFENPNVPGETLAVLGSASGLRVVRWNAQDHRPQMVQLRSADQKEGCENYLTPGLGWWTSAADYHFSPGGPSIELSLGYGGVKRVFLSEPVAADPASLGKP